VLIADRDGGYFMFKKSRVTSSAFAVHLSFKKQASPFQAASPLLIATKDLDHST